VVGSTSTAGLLVSALGAAFSGSFYPFLLIRIS